MVDFQRDVYCVLGLPFDATDMAGAVHRVRGAVSARAPCIIATPNLNFIVGCFGDEEFRDAILNCDLSIPDGMPEVWIARLLQIPIHRRVAGSSLFEVLKEDRTKPLSVYFFGGEADAAGLACQRLNSEAAGMYCAGSEFPGFGPVEAMSSTDTIEKINASGADFLVVALGARKGHAWIEHNRRRIAIPVISHLGAVMNFTSGRLRRAPAWMQQNGLEWAWRIKEEPALWRRYARDGVYLLKLLATRVLPHAVFLRRHRPAIAELLAANAELRVDRAHAVVSLKGAWTRDNLGPLRAVLAEAVLTRKDILLDMGGVSHVDAALLALVILLHGHQREAGRRLWLSSPGRSVRRVIRYSCAEYLYADSESMPAGNRLGLLNGQFDPLTLPQTVDAVFRLLDDGERGWLSTFNVAILMMMRSNPRLQSFVDRSALIVADGQPLVWCAPWFGRPLPERVTGVDLVDALCARSAREGRRVFLLGAHDRIVVAVTQLLRERHPGLQVDCADGYFGQGEAAARADRVRASKADILFVGMGVPRQESFIEEQWDRLGVGMAIGVGGSFEVLAGIRTRAPRWVQKIGMEWFFRLVQEPRRLFPRYLETNSRFVWLVARALLKGGQAS